MASGSSPIYKIRTHRPGDMGLIINQHAILVRETVSHDKYDGLSRCDSSDGYSVGDQVSKQTLRASLLIFSITSILILSVHS